ncbi:thermonuclease family protein [Mesorhizobium loti]|uniref:thermonuclease family protein n=1 Tax=Rhizobium loti TaxID=381 RepID=UPI001FD9C56E|nr:thermonuclease family protein [Mesorhizobium loti]
MLLIVWARGSLSVDESTPTSPPSAEIHQTDRPTMLTIPARRRSPARTVAQDLITPPQLDPDQLERIEARPPLSDLGLAVPPKTPMPQDWREVLLYRPIATSSVTFEAMGRNIAISGVQGVDLDKTCSFHDVAWPCGQRARAVFTSWLRGRALNCFVPPETERFAIAAPCRLGRQDAGAWLVSNGWATALPSGIYSKAEAVAKGAQMGIFGPPQ